MASILTPTARLLAGPRDRMPSPFQPKRLDIELPGNAEPLFRRSFEAHLIAVNEFTDPHPYKSMRQCVVQFASWHDETLDHVSAVLEHKTPDPKAPKEWKWYPLPKHYPIGSTPPRFHGSQHTINAYHLPPNGTFAQLHFVSLMESDPTRHLRLRLAAVTIGPTAYKF